MQPQTGPTRAIEARFQRGLTKTITTVHPYIAQRRGGSSNALRWALYRADGSLSNSFAAGLDRFDVEVLLAAAGFTLLADDTVVPAAHPPVFEPVGRGIAA